MLASNGVNAKFENEMNILKIYPPLLFPPPFIKGEVRGVTLVVCCYPKFS